MTAPLHPGADPATPARFDVCNGDADGLCSVVQWRLHDPAPATLITGRKREIELLGRVDARAGDEVLVCDVSMQRNRDALVALLARGVRVRYFDHHDVGEIPSHPGLDAHIELGPELCTSVLVDRYLRGAWRAWAAVGAYGDNLRSVGDALAASAGASGSARERLRRLGEAINYNAYGESDDDILVAPHRLFALLVRHRDPLRFIEDEPVAAQLETMRDADLARAKEIAPLREDAAVAIHVLPDARWSRRVLGSFANELARAHRSRAHAVLRESGDTYAVSVRAPLDAPTGAGALCARFGGNGRASAGGIDSLRADELGTFVDALVAFDWAGALRRR